jgi:hypothetical protein
VEYAEFQYSELNIFLFLDTNKDKQVDASEAKRLNSWLSVNWCAHAAGIKMLALAISLVV